MYINQLHVIMNLHVHVHVYFPLTTVHLLLHTLIKQIPMLPTCGTTGPMMMGGPNVATWGWLTWVPPATWLPVCSTCTWSPRPGSPCYRPSVPTPTATRARWWSSRRCLPIYRSIHDTCLFDVKSLFLGYFCSIDTLSGMIKSVSKVFTFV